MPQRLSTAIADISWLCIVVLAFSIAFVGCTRKGPAIAPVKGRVLLDGQPLTTGSVITLPTAGRGAKSFIQRDGAFQLGTFGANDGAIVGEHKVAVVAYDRPANAGPESGNGKLLVPQQYTNPESSGLAIDVPPEGNNDVVISLTSASQRK
jgi:hypothetical protein